MSFPAKCNFCSPILILDRSIWALTKKKYNRIIRPDLLTKHSCDENKRQAKSVTVRMGCLFTRYANRLPLLSLVLFTSRTDSLLRYFEKKYKQNIGGQNSWVMFLQLQLQHSTNWFDVIMQCYCQSVSQVFSGVYFVSFFLFCNAGIMGSSSFDHWLF